MWIPWIAIVGSMVVGLGCSKDGGVLVPTGGGGGTSSTTTAGGSGGTTDSGTTTLGGSGGDTGTTTSSSSSATAGSGGSGGTTSSGGSSGGTTSTTTVVDEDQDGWSYEDGDCCDSAAAFCSDLPELVNPGAIEVPGNQVDDDCNPATLDTDPYPTCSAAALANADLANGAVVSSLKLVKAMDLCQFTQEDPALPQKTWGVIAADYLLADGSPAPAPKNIQFGVLPNFGPNVLPQYGETLAMLSSGTARREGDPGFVHPKSGPAAGQNGNFDAQTSCPAPAGYLAAHGGSLPSQCGNCMGPDCATAFDSAQLRVRIRPPTNAKGFSYRLSFYSSEYPQYVCQDYNDFFLTLLSGNVTPEIPADGNVAFDDTDQPISVNNLLFDVCLPSPGYPCQGGTLELIGNGWGGWNGSVSDGGTTGWLSNEVPLAMKPNPNPGGDPIPTGETLEIRFTLWDGGDHHVDSAVLLDRFRWSPQPVTLDTHD